MLLLSHPLTALLYDGAHGTTFELARLDGETGMLARPSPAGWALTRVKTTAARPVQPTVAQVRDTLPVPGLPPPPPVRCGQGFDTKASFRY